jgi:hypothetical protein
MDSKIKPLKVGQCFDFALGQCGYGARCKFDHDSSAIVQANKNIQHRIDRATNLHIRGLPSKMSNLTTFKSFVTSHFARFGAIKSSRILERKTDNETDSDPDYENSVHALINFENHSDAKRVTVALFECSRGC